MTLVAIGSGFHLPKNDAECKGVCLQVHKCKSLEQRFGKSMSKEKANYLKISGCGFDDGIPMICCPFTEQEQDEREIHNEEIETQTDVSTFERTFFDDLDEGNGMIVKLS